MTPGRQRALAWGAVVAGAVVAFFLSTRSGSDGDTVKALATATLAAAGASMLLQSLGRRLVALLGLLLAAGLVALPATGEGHVGLYAAGALVGVGALVQLVCAGRWPSRQERYERGTATRAASDADVWKAMDAGMDPTADEFGDRVSSREDSPNSVEQEA